MPPMPVTAWMVGFVEVECRDEKEIIGTGFHERAVIDPARSLARLEEAAG